MHSTAVFAKIGWFRMVYKPHSLWYNRSGNRFETNCGNAAERVAYEKTTSAYLSLCISLYADCRGRIMPGCWVQCTGVRPESGDSAGGYQYGGCKSAVRPRCRSLRHHDRGLAE